jgi:DNA mismatch repair protein MutS
MMQQYNRAKKEVGDALLFFRMGDFYELFHEDAKVAARVLGITLTARSKGEGAIPMAGVPVKAYEGYLQTLIKGGHRVAICDQVQDPAAAKGLVERRVTRIVTAGTVYEDDLLERGSSNYLLAVAPAGSLVGLAWIEISTGAFRVCALPAERIADEVSRLDPAEVLVPESLLNGESTLADTVRRATDAPLVPGPEWTFDRGNAGEALLEGLGVATLAGFGLEDDHPAISAAGAVLAYARHTQRGDAVPVSAVTLHDPDARAGLDRATRSCLEIIQTQRTGQRDGALLSVMDETGTAMGARLLREWLVAPLIDPAQIARRQGAVAELVARSEVHAALDGLLDGLPDIERVASRLLAGRGSPRDLSALRTGLRAVPELARVLSSCDAPPLAQAAAELTPLPELLELLERGLAEHPAATLVDGGVIADGWNATLDELRSLRTNGADALARFQAAESEASGIPGLKVGFNRVFGYYIEITHVQAAAAGGVPETYTRKQTLTSAERYITPELKELESSILNAEDRGRALEIELFGELRAQAAASGEAVRELARQIARVDVLAGFATLARERGWVRPVVDDGDTIDVKDGRHPVLDVILPAGQFVPNDVLLDRDGARLVLITGPNMAGKSTYIRQVALLVLLAQVGSFVPASEARVGVVDRIFTRVGAADDLSGGQSTFMVEMTETAAILNGASERSLVILDEVGRGTSTWDGLSLAWAISEYLYRKLGARTLFATHYHELVALAEEFPAVRNVNVSVREWGDEIAFLHKIVPGGTDRSYGLHVARLAGVPAPVIERARRILGDLEQRSPDLRPGPKESVAGGEEPEPLQEHLFPRPAAAILRELSELDPDLVSPMEALVLLRKFCERMEGRGEE